MIKRTSKKYINSVLKSNKDWKVLDLGCGYSANEYADTICDIQNLSDLPSIDEIGSAGLIDTSAIDKSIFGTGKFFKEQSVNEKQKDIYEDIDEAIKKAPEDEK